MPELHVSHELSGYSSASASARRVGPGPRSRPSSPPASLNPPHRLAPGYASGQLHPARAPSVPRSAFATTRLPRTSSLLPPPHPVAHPAISSGRSTATGGHSQTFDGHREGPRPPVSLKRPQTPPSQTERSGSSRPSSRDGLSARNRWSASSVSTASSRASFLAPRTAASPSHHRRATSVDAVASRDSPPSSNHSPSRPQTGRLPRPSTSRKANPAAIHPTKPDIVISSTRNIGKHLEQSTSEVSSGFHIDTMPHDQGRDHYQPRGHSRGRSGKGSNDSGKGRAGKTPSQKAMLSRALQKANTAVQLDNAQNFEGARQAYAEACDLLHQVLRRTTADEDKRKLEAIRRTYTARIAELDQMGPWQDDTVKALPARPESEEYGQEIDPGYGYGQDISAIGKAKSSGIGEARAAITQGNYLNSSSHQHYQETSYRRIIQPDRSLSLRQPENTTFRSSSRGNERLRLVDEVSHSTGNNAGYLPAPLTSARSVSPHKPPSDASSEPVKTESQDTSASSRNEHVDAPGHAREDSQNSWLDPIDESGGSTTSSVHSRTSSQGYRRRHIRAASGDTETEFDTALDAAIEAAYDDGYEPMEAEELKPTEAIEDPVSSVLRKVELARERVRQTERETYMVVRELERNRQPLPQLQQQRNPYSRNAAEDFYDDDNSSDEEERILEEMTRDYSIDEFTMEPQRPAPGIQAQGMDTRAPDNKQADGSRNNKLGANLSLASPDRPHLLSISKSFQPVPPPTQSLPELPNQRPSSPSQSVRNRRLSGQNPKQLTIETAKLGPPLQIHSEEMLQSRSAIVPDKDQELAPEESSRSVSAQHRRSPPSVELNLFEPPAIGSIVSNRGHVDADDKPAVGSTSPSMSKLRKNFSSSSLRSMKSRNMSLSNLEDALDMSPGTPSNPFGSSRAPAMPALPTPLAAAFRENMEAVASGGLYLFDDNFHMPNTPGSPNPLSLDAPVPLEPCPADFMLRPFWLMRCLYQTLVHPRGGYLSTKLFVPRDVWRVKGVKLKNIEDKISNCDYLTAALLKLARVDTLDADAVLEEMQSLEGILEQIQTALARKLGNEVGVHSSAILFKEASVATDGEGGSAVPRTTSVSGKSSSFSWRRLRPKNSAVGLSASYNNRVGSSDGPKEVANMPTLPMTPQPTNRPAKRDVSQAQFLGPNANYMGSLARLFDAAQALDQIARQVEDPGLRHADKTQVGLELCTRHAAEFFGFYICRFVLADLGMLLDKFIKRGSEWVLA